MTFSERLKSLRINKSMTQPQVCQHIGIGISTLQYYERGAKEPTLSKLIAFADLFEVSLDYLVGRTDNPEINK